MLQIKNYLDSIVGDYLKVAGTVVSGYWTVLAGRLRTQACYDWLANAMHGRGLSVRG
jgi:hypothetical protein